MSHLRSTAAELVLEVAKRMADPAALELTALDSGGRTPSGEAAGQPMWEPLSLASGFPGVTLLPAELGHHDRYFRRVAHEYLAAAGKHASHALAGGLYNGLAAYSFAAHAAAHGPEDYGLLRSRVDGRTAEFMAGFAGARRTVLADGGHKRQFHDFDVISGVTGVGRHLLAAGEAAAAQEVLSYVVELVLSQRDDLGEGVPGWWVDHGMTFEDDTPGGHGNFGLAHGISGPLALLAIAWGNGYRHERVESAVRKIVSWLQEWQQGDEAGPFWPTGIGLHELAVGRPHDGSATRPSWCYGTPGIANSLRLAGEALGEPDWVRTARSALAGALSRTTIGLTGPSICHGHAGLLVVAEAFRHMQDSDALGQAADRLAGSLIDSFDSEAPFGFTVIQEATGLRLNHPGFLDGAVGILLALWCYATGAPARSGWDRALLLA
ncbi:lanthionine synthetase C family protein [Kitasatospora hibisci]|uniref:lanthionine synthetase C family protein n=1 Tax=Kitasatospora hibisci TaxID=3369522 RepID=UPI00375504E8